VPQKRGIVRDLVPQIILDGQRTLIEKVRYGRAPRRLVRIVSETASSSLVPELLDAAIAHGRKAFGVHA
jgi:hypothetical protein